GLVVVGIDVPLHLKGIGQFGLKRCLETFQGYFSVKLALQAHKKYTGLFVHMLVQINDISLLLMYEGGNGTNDSRLIGTVYQYGELHGSLLKAQNYGIQKRMPKPFVFFVKFQSKSIITCIFC